MAEYARRKGHRLMSQINVVPYIDVMLVLLVIFMVTAPLITTTVIDLPSISRNSVPPTAPIELIVKTKDHILIRDRERGQGERRISQDELVKLLRAKQKEKTDQPVVIAADKTVPYGEVVEIMDLLQRNQIKKVGLLAKPQSMSKQPEPGRFTSGVLALAVHILFIALAAVRNQLATAGARSRGSRSLAERFLFPGRNPFRAPRRNLFRHPPLQSLKRRRPNRLRPAPEPKAQVPPPPAEPSRADIELKEKQRKLKEQKAAEELRREEAKLHEQERKKQEAHDKEQARKQEQARKREEPASEQEDARRREADKRQEEVRREEERRMEHEAETRRSVILEEQQKLAQARASEGRGGCPQACRGRGGVGQAAAAPAIYRSHQAESSRPRGGAAWPHRKSQGRLQRNLAAGGRGAGDQTRQIQWCCGL